MDNDITLHPVFLPLAVTAIVAVIACITKSRAAFFVGTAACWLGTTGQPKVYSLYRPGTSFEHMYISQLGEQWQYYTVHVPIAAATGVVVALLCTKVVFARTSITTVESNSKPANLC